MNQAIFNPWAAQGKYSVFVGNQGWVYGFHGLKQARDYVRGFPGKRYDIHKGPKLVESGKVHAGKPGTTPWLVQNPRESTSKTWARQRSEGEKRWQVSIHHAKVPTRVFDTLAEAKALVSRVKRGRTYQGVHYDIFDRETGDFKESGVIGEEGRTVRNPARTLRFRTKAAALAYASAHGLRVKSIRKVKR